MKSIWSQITGLSDDILNQSEMVEVKQKNSAEGLGHAGTAEGESQPQSGKKDKKKVEEKRLTGKETFLNKPEVDGSWLAEQYEGELAVDTYEDGPNLIIISTLAGVNPKDIDLSVEKDLITIRGKREKNKEMLNKNYFNQECFWGKFSRTVILPYEINPEGVKADLKNGILTIILPKVEKKKGTKLEIE